MEDSPPYNGVSTIQTELPKLTLRDVPEENSFSSVSSPAPGPLNSPLGPMSTDIGDLHDVPINDNTDILSTNVMQTQSTDMVYFKLLIINNKILKKYIYIIYIFYRYPQILPMFF